MLTSNTYDQLATLPVTKASGYQRYATLAGLALAHQGQGADLISTIEFVKGFYPGLMDRSPADITRFHHWLRQAAKHHGAAAGTVQRQGRGYNKGKTVTQYLWHKPFSIQQLV